MLLLLYTSIKLFKTELLIETVNTSAGINKLLLAGEERMAVGTNFDLDVALC